MEVRERFEAKVDRTGDCHVWQAAQTPFGYGVFFVGSRKVPGSRRMALAHRVAWEMEHGPIPDGKQINHRCPGGDNPACVNPDHLYLGTQAENIRDLHERGNPRSNPKHGDSHPNTYLKTAEVLMIRKMRENGCTMSSIADQFHTTTATVFNIIHRKTWAHV